MEKPQHYYTKCNQIRHIVEFCKEQKNDTSNNTNDNNKWQ
jgi:hypothetical protein